MSTASNYDAAWKDALESYFPQFMALLWPDSSRRYSARRQRTRPGSGHASTRHKEVLDLGGLG
ncbi:MAG: hypothetical protein AB7E55_29125, partial [Pigmentiphaga sp.]